MKIFQTQVSMREFLAFIFVAVVIRGAEYYLFSQNILTLDQYRLSIQALVTLIFMYPIALVFRNQNIMKLRPSRHTKMYKKDDGTMDEPTMYSIKGGGEWYDASYHGLLVHRNYNDKTVKVKFQNLGENQAEAHFKWDHISGDYIPHEQVKIDAMPWEP